MNTIVFHYLDHGIYGEDFDSLSECNCMECGVRMERGQQAVMVSAEDERGRVLKWLFFHGDCFKEDTM
jgi:hypothetical protein